MAGLTRSTLRTQAKQRADMARSTPATTGQFVTDDEWNTYLDYSASKLFDLIAKYDEFSMQTQQDITIVNGTMDYALNPDFNTLIAAYWMDNNQPTYPLERTTMHELGYQQGFEIALNIGRPYKYIIIGQNLRFYPLPNLSGKVRVQYLKQYTRFVDDSSTLDYPIVNGWEEFVVLDTAVKALVKEESIEQASALKIERDELQARIVDSLRNKDSFNPKFLRDTTGTTYRFRRYRGSP